MSVWLIIANPYAYDKALSQATILAQSLQAELRVVYFIEANSVNDMIHELSESGWLGAASLRTLQTSMSQGYQGLADDVLKRVQRKVQGVRVAVEGVVETPSLENYVKQIIAQGAARVVIAGSNAIKFENLPKNVAYIEEE
ncbi:MAG: hypothetical protein ACFB4I_16120 [Cyanophyceae cyanobacterium]